MSTVEACPTNGLAAAPPAWIHIGLSRDYRRGRVKRLRRWGHDLVAYRADSGRIVLHEATCPHLGAHLGGGTVRGECIECPFHNWQFTPDGAVHYVPGSRRLPARARLTTYPTIEVGGIAFMYPRPTGPGDGVPPFDPTIAEELAKSTFRTSILAMSIPGDLAEIQENAADSAHLSVVHSPPTLSTQRFDGSIEDSEFVVTGTMSVRVGGDVDVVIRCFDPCSTMTATAGERFSNETFSFGAQVQPKLTEMLFLLRVPRGPAVVDRIILRSTRRQMKRVIRDDTPIWRGKTWLDRPIISDADGPIRQYREWLSSFGA